MHDPLVSAKQVPVEQGFEEALVAGALLGALLHSVLVAWVRHEWGMGTLGLVRGSLWGVCMMRWGWVTWGLHLGLCWLHCTGALLVALHRGSAGCIAQGAACFWLVALGQMLHSAWALSMELFE